MKYHNSKEERDTKIQNAPLGGFQLLYKKQETCTM